MTTKYFQKTWCDGPGCREVKIFKENGVDNPSWWGLTHWVWNETDHNALLTDHIDLDFCSLKCLEEWCKEQSSKSA